MSYERLGGSPVRSARPAVANRSHVCAIDSELVLKIGFNGLTRSNGQSRALAAEHDRARLFRLRDSRAGVCRKL